MAKIINGQYSEDSRIESDAIWQKKGDIAVANGASSASVLPLGEPGKVLTAHKDGVKWELSPNSITIQNDPAWFYKGELAVGVGSKRALILKQGQQGQILAVEKNAKSGLEWKDNSASSIAYNDTKTQTIGADTVQDAIDRLKTTPNYLRFLMFGHGSDGSIVISNNKNFRLKKDLNCQTLTIKNGSIEVSTQHIRCSENLDISDAGQNSIVCNNGILKISSKKISKSANSQSFVFVNKSDAAYIEILCEDISGSPVEKLISALGSYSNIKLFILKTNQFLEKTCRKPTSMDA